MTQGHCSADLMHCRLQPVETCRWWRGGTAQLSISRKLSQQPQVDEGNRTCTIPLRRLPLPKQADQHFLGDQIGNSFALDNSLFDLERNSHGSRS